VGKTLQNPLKMIPEKFVKKKKEQIRGNGSKEKLFDLSSESPSQEQEEIKKSL